MDINPISVQFANDFLDTHHPLRAGYALRGVKVAYAGYENGLPVFCAVFTAPRSRWKHYPVALELSRLAWSPLANKSAATFLRKCLRRLKRDYKGLVVTYALPGTDGIVYIRSGFWQDGTSSGCARSRRGPNGRPTPDTIGTGKKLPRFFAVLGGLSAGRAGAGGN